MFSFFSRGRIDYNIDAETFSQKLKNDINSVILDVRTYNEYSKGHIPGSVNLDIHDDDFHNKIEKFDRSKNYYIYCRSGSRSLHASKVMKAAGFNVVFNLEGGILEWKEPLVS